VQVRRQRTAASIWAEVERLAALQMGLLELLLQATKSPSNYLANIAFRIIMAVGARIPKHPENQFIINQPNTFRKERSGFSHSYYRGPSNISSSATPIN